MNFQKYLAELVGTFVLALAVGLSLAVDSVVPTPVVAGLTLGLFVYTVGHVSGAHLNPAITLAVLSIKKMSVQDAIGYWVSQFLGAWLAWFVGGKLVTYEVLTVSQEPMVAVAEGIGAAVFAFGVAAVVYGHIPRDITGIAVGGSLLLGILLASSVSNGVLNPAVALGIGSFSSMYVLGPLVGALVGMWVFKGVSNERK